MNRLSFFLLLMLLPLSVSPSVTLADFVYNGKGYYEISSPEDMVKLSKYINPVNPSDFNDWGHTTESAKVVFKVTVSELDFEGITDFAPIGMSIPVDEWPRSVPFRGTFDGQGVVIKNLRINSQAERCVGLFGLCSGSISGVTLDASCSIAGQMYVGGIVGKLDRGGTISMCNNYASISGTDGVGGIVGNTHVEVTVELCKNYGEVSGFEHIGGIAGAVSGSNGSTDFVSVNDCFNTGSIIGYHDVGGIAGMVVSNMRNCTNCGVVAINDERTDDYQGSYGCVGGIVGYSLGLIDVCINEGDVTSNTASGYDIGGIAGCAGRGIISNCVVRGCTIKGSCQLGAIAWNQSEAALSENIYTSDVIVIYKDVTYDGDAERGRSDGDSIYDVTQMNVNGTVYYNCAVLESRRIEVPEPEITLADFVYNNSGYYEIRSAEDMARLSKLVNAGNGCADVTFRVSATSLDFSGINDFKPIGYFNSSDDKSPFYGAFDGQNVPIRNLIINGEDLQYVGLFGYVKGNIRNVFIDETCNFISNKVCGTIVGMLDRGTVSHCTNNAALIMEEGDGGGIAGHSTGTIEECINYGTISSAISGGIVSWIYGDPEEYDYYIATVKKCSNYGLVKSTGYAIGGIAASSSAGDVISCENYGEIVGEESNAGGIIGAPAYSVVDRCKNSGTVTGGSSGGIVGNTSFSNILDSSNDADIFGSTYAGGILGNTFNEVSNWVMRELTQTRIQGCTNVGNISSHQTAGGIAGNIGVLEEEEATADIYVNTAYIGHCSHSGDVSVLSPSGSIDTYAGGIVGHVLYWNTIEDCLVLSGTISDVGSYPYPFAGAIIGARTKHYNGPEPMTLARNYYYDNVCVVMHDKTFSGDTPRGVCLISQSPSDVYGNDGAVLRYGEPDGITIPHFMTNIDKVFTIDGKTTKMPTHGVNIFRTDSGVVKKILLR